MPKNDDPAVAHEFWNTQPVPQEAHIKQEGPIETKTIDDVRKEPYPLASVLEWWVPDMANSEEDLNKIYELLKNNYVEDDDSLFRFNYSHNFLKWAMTPPGYIQNWHVAVRTKKDQEVMAFVCGIPMEVAITRTVPEGDRTSDVVKMCEINFLCIHKKLRGKRLAPILIKEVTRRVNCTGIWQAVYTSGTVLPTPFTSANYFHRSLNPEKLVAIGFSRLPPQYQKFQNPMSMMKRNFALPERHKLSGFRAMVEADVPAVHRLLSEGLREFRVAPVFNEEEVRHWLLPLPGVVFTYVVEDGKKNVTDMVSFYNLPSTVIGNPAYQDLNAAYSYYSCARTVPLKSLFYEALIAAKNANFDVFNTVDILNNSEFLSDLKFCPGDGKLHYYFYNWSYPSVEANKVGLVML